MPCIALTGHTKATATTQSLYFRCDTVAEARSSKIEELAKLDWGNFIGSLSCFNTVEF